jgi:dTDP-4-dehydrorhamnose reductase
MIARTGWVFGPGGRNFVDTMRERAANRTPSRVVQDQHGAPTSSRFIASVLLELVKAGSGGVWHVAPSGSTTWFEVARLIYTAAGADPALVSPCDSAELGRPAPRPRFAVLDTAATARALGRPLPPWQRDVESYVTTGSLPCSAWEREDP